MTRRFTPWAQSDHRTSSITSVHHTANYPLPVLLLLLQEAGYDESSQLLIEDVMMSKNIPDPRDIRKYDLIGVFGMINYRTLRVRALPARLADDG